MSSAYAEAFLVLPERLGDAGFGHVDACAVFEESDEHLVEVVVRSGRGLRVGVERVRVHLEDSELAEDLLDRRVGLLQTAGLEQLVELPADLHSLVDGDGVELLPVLRDQLEELAGGQHDVHVPQRRVWSAVGTCGSLWSKGLELFVVAGSDANQGDCFERLVRGVYEAGQTEEPAQDVSGEHQGRLDAGTELDERVFHDLLHVADPARTLGGDQRLCLRLLDL